MALFGISKDEVRKQVRDAREESYENGYKDGEREQKYRVEELETSLERKNKEIKKLQRQLADSNEEVEVLTQNKTEARKLVTERLENESAKADLDAREKVVAKREKTLTEKEEKLVAREASEDDKRYKEGYADGVSDGVRKIGEITAADRKDAMDVAKISAASHSSSDTVKAVLDGKVETSLKDKKTK